MRQAALQQHFALSSLSAQIQPGACPLCAESAFALAAASAASCPSGLVAALSSVPLFQCVCTRTAPVHSLHPVCAGSAFSLAAASAASCPPGLVAALSSVPLFKCVPVSAHSQDMPVMRQAVASRQAAHELCSGFAEVVQALLAAGTPPTAQVQVNSLPC